MLNVERENMIHLQTLLIYTVFLLLLVLYCSVCRLCLLCRQLPVYMVRIQGYYPQLSPQPLLEGSPM